MLLIIHILIALSSILLAGLAFLKPTQSKLTTSYILVAGTFATGTALVVMAPAHLMSACISGLLYLGLVSAGIFSARHKLSKLGIK